MRRRLAAALHRFAGRQAFECPCGAYRVVAGRQTPSWVIDAHLGEHYLECVVAQADTGLRALLDPC